jgi:transcriptional regulator with XRE-family HTH domain
MNQDQRHEAAGEIRLAMDAQSLSAAELARMAGVSKNTITGVLRGDASQPSTLRKLRDALGIRPRVVVAEEQGYDADVETFALAVKVWLADLPRLERPAAIAAMFTAVSTYRDRLGENHPNG